MSGLILNPYGKAFFICYPIVIEVFFGCRGFALIWASYPAFNFIGPTPNREKEKRPRNFSLSR